MTGETSEGPPTVQSLAAILALALLIPALRAVAAIESEV